MTKLQFTSVTLNNGIVTGMTTSDVLEGLDYLEELTSLRYRMDQSYGDTFHTESGVVCQYNGALYIHTVNIIP